MTSMTEDATTTSATDFGWTPSFYSLEKLSSSHFSAQASKQAVQLIDKDVDAVRKALAHESAECIRVEAIRDHTLQRLSDCEHQIRGLTDKLKVMRTDGDQLQQQLQEKMERRSELQRKLQKMQDVNRSLESDLAAAEERNSKLEAKVRTDELAKQSLDAFVQQLQSKVKQLEQVLQEASISSPEAGEAVNVQLDSEEQLNTLRLQFEETLKALQRRRCSASVDSVPPSPSVHPEAASGPGLGRLKTPTRGVELSVLSKEVTSTASSVNGTSESDMQGLAVSMRGLSEIKALKKPPPPIRMLMEVCCLLFHIKPVKLPDETSIQCRLRVDYWEPARRFLLSDPFLLSKLRSYNEDIPANQRAKIKKYFQDPEFTPERVLKCSKAAFELFTCVNALIAKWPA